MKLTSPKSTAPAYICISIRQSTKKQATNSYLRQQDKVKVMNTCGDAALILYEFYISRSGMQDYRFEDANVARSLEWNPSKVKKNRLKLTQQGFFYQRKGKLNDGARTIITYLDPVQIKKDINPNPIALQLAPPVTVNTPKPNRSLFLTAEPINTAKPTT